MFQIGIPCWVPNRYIRNCAGVYVIYFNWGALEFRNQRTKTAVSNYAIQRISVDVDTLIALGWRSRMACEAEISPKGSVTKSSIIVRCYR